MVLCVIVFNPYLGHIYLPINKFDRHTKKIIFSFRDPKTNFQLPVLANFTYNYELFSQQKSYFLRSNMLHAKLLRDLFFV